MADETKLTAATRLEKLLDNIAGGENEVTPATRLEKFLSYIADAMEGGGGSGSGLYGLYYATNQIQVTINANSTESVVLAISDSDGEVYDIEEETKILISAFVDTTNFMISYSGPYYYDGSLYLSVHNRSDSQIVLPRVSIGVNFYSDAELIHVS